MAVLAMAILTMAVFAMAGCTCYGWLYLLRLYLLQERASSISRVVDSVLSTVAATCDWAEEACHACTMHLAYI